MYVDGQKTGSIDNVTLENPDMDTDNNFEQKLINEDLTYLIKNALKKLDEKTEEVIILKIWENMKFIDIGKIIDENEGTVKMRYYRGIDKLKKYLEKSKKQKMFGFGLPVIVFGITQLGKSKEFIIDPKFARALLDQIRENNLFFNKKRMNKLGELFGTAGGKILLGFVALVIIGGAILVGVGYAILKPNSGEEGELIDGKDGEHTDEVVVSAEPTVSPEPTVTPTVDHYATWQKLTNAKYKFSLRYPDVLEICEDCNPFDPHKDKDASVETIAILADMKTILHETDKPWNGISVYVVTLSNNKSFESYINDEKQFQLATAEIRGMGGNGSETKLEINGMHFVKLVGYSWYGSSLTGYYLLFPDTKHILVIYSSTYEEPLRFSDIEILKTIKFE